LPRTSTQITFFKKPKCLQKVIISKGRIFFSAAEFFDGLAGNFCKELATPAWILTKEKIVFQNPRNPDPHE
jgi:hypothetical protein